MGFCPLRRLELSSVKTEPMWTGHVTRSEERLGVDTSYQTMDGQCYCHVNYILQKPHLLQ